MVVNEHVGAPDLQAQVRVRWPGLVAMSIDAKAVVDSDGVPS
jgi:hypothetical protein